jgi:putative heme-binding domain-containing protein
MRLLSLLVAPLLAMLLAGSAPSQNKNDPYAQHIASTDPRTPADERKQFALPPGFDIQLVASEPDIHKPLNIAFDAHGRLWVTDTVEYPFPAGPGKKPRDTVKVLEDFGPDGKARKITTFADGLNIPIGVLPLPGTNPQEAMVYNIPGIWKMRDTKNTGKASERVLLYEKYGSRDTHGMTNAFTLGFDGWVYACHGYSNTSTVKGADGAAVTMTSGNTYRMRTDGSHLEQWTHGQVNPFGLAFDPLGNLYSCDCHTQPVYQLLRGAWYPSFGKPHDGLGFGPEAMFNYPDSTAIAGIAFYAADHFPQENRGAVYIGDVVTNRVNRFALTFHGSTPRATKFDFLRSKDPWFRPVDVKLGPDGALYIADFYNRIIGHYEVPLDHPGRDRERGRIWRVVYTGKDGKGRAESPRADWTKATTTELVGDLAHPNLTVRLLATNQLVERGKAAVAEVEKARAKPTNSWQHAHALWVLDRLAKLDDEALTAAVKDRDALVRVHGLRILAERGRWSKEQGELVRGKLNDADPNVARAAAAALGKHADFANVMPLLTLRTEVPKEDTHLLHVVRMALRDQMRIADNWKKLDEVKLSPASVAAIADISLGVPSAEAAAFLLSYVKDGAGSSKVDAIAHFVHHVARHGTAETTAALLQHLRSQKGNPGRQVAMFRAVERGTQERGAPLAPEARNWAVGLTQELLDSKNDAERQAGVELVGSLRLQKYEEQLIATATNQSAAEPLRAAALTSLNTLDSSRHAVVLGKVLAAQSSPMTLREHAVRLLSQANQAEGREQLATVLALAPAKLQNAIAAGLAGSKQGAEKLLAAVAAGKASARLLQERAVETRLKGLRVPDLEKRLAKLTEGLPSADKRLLDLLTKRKEGFQKAKASAERGALVFQKSCANCHQIGGKGAKIGPQLDGIGIRGVERLLEDTLDPNRNVDQAFRRTILNLKKGGVVSGLLLKQEGEVLVLADEQGKEVRVPEKDVEEKTVSQMSPMPANFADQIQEAEFYDLLAYLLTQRVADKH